MNKHGISSSLYTEKTRQAYHRLDSLNYCREVFREHVAQVNAKKDREFNLGACAAISLVLWFALLVYMAV